MLLGILECFSSSCHLSLPQGLLQAFVENGLTPGTSSRCWDYFDILVRLAKVVCSVKVTWRHILGSLLVSLVSMV